MVVDLCTESVSSILYNCQHGMGTSNWEILLTV